MTQLTAASLNQALPTYNDDSVLDQQQRALQAAINAIDQAPGPSLREVLGAYRLKGDGDREMLLAILNAKAAEDQVFNLDFYVIHMLTYLSRRESPPWLHYIRLYFKLFIQARCLLRCLLWPQPECPMLQHRD
jgi:hypothetical protein